MNIRIDRSFEKATDKIKDRKLLNKIARVIDEIKEQHVYSKIKNLKKIKGSHQYYRIRIGDYKNGITIAGDMVTFIRFLHRKDIYKYFP